ncbi:MAG: hypothetical protein E7321_01515 [Clostridiales bacterium]|nr:hypothetical protein [Clostridiales bacterium]
MAQYEGNIYELIMRCIALRSSGWMIGEVLTLMSMALEDENGEALDLLADEEWMIGQALAQTSGKGLENWLTMRKLAYEAIFSVESFMKQCRSIGTYKDEMRYIRAFRKKMEYGKDDFEKCVLWKNFFRCLAVIRPETDDEAYTRACELIDRIEITRENASAKKAGYLYRVIESADTSSRIRIGFNEQIRMSAKRNEGEDRVLVTGTEYKDEEFCAVISMMAYVYAKQGRFDRIAQDMTIAQISYLVCFVHQYLVILSQKVDPYTQFKMYEQMNKLEWVLIRLWFSCECEKNAAAPSVLVTPAVYAEEILTLFYSSFAKIDDCKRKWDADGAIHNEANAIRVDNVIRRCEAMEEYRKEHEIHRADKTAEYLVNIYGVYEKLAY